MDWSLEKYLLKKVWEFEGVEQGALLGFEFPCRLGRSFEVISRS